MENNAEAYIFLRETRDVTANENFRIVTIWEAPAASTCLLHAVLEVTLAPGKSREMDLENAQLLVLPVVGDILAVSGLKEDQVECGRLLHLEGTGVAAVSNIYESDLVKCLLIKLRGAAVAGRLVNQLFVFDLEQPGGTAAVLRNKDVNLSLVKLAMRGEATCPLEAGSTAFVYVLQGSAEVSGRLLHDGDSLAIGNCAELEIESLGTESILLVTEVRSPLFTTEM